MKLYILRHEDRPQDCSFFTPLTELGLKNSINLIPILEKCNINYIISSPFIRTLETIYPYSKKHNLFINIDYSLSEIHHQDNIAKNAVGMDIPKFIATKYNYNKSYKSLISPTHIKYPEKYNNVVKRVKKFLKYIFLRYYSKNYNIVLITHQSLCKSIVEIINKLLINNSINKELINDYPKGKLCLVFDKYWTFKEIN